MLWFIREFHPVAVINSNVHMTIFHAWHLQNVCLFYILQQLAASSTPRASQQLVMDWKKYIQSRTNYQFNTTKVQCRSSGSVTKISNGQFVKWVRSNTNAFIPIRLIAKLKLTFQFEGRKSAWKVDFFFKYITSNTYSYALYFQFLTQCALTL